MSQRTAWLPWFLSASTLLACTPSTQPAVDVVSAQDTQSPVDRVAVDSVLQDMGPGLDVQGRDAQAQDLVLQDSVGMDVVGRDVHTADHATVDQVSVDVVVASVCGSEAPSSGTACNRDGLVCEYGTDPRPSCRTQATCTAGQWLVYAPRCPPLPVVTCPATRAEAAGQSCDTMDAICSYEGLNCTCTNCTETPLPQCSGPTTWHCEAPHSDPACPAAMPLQGLACTLEDQVCNYGCAPGTGRTCVQGVWQASDPPGGCPCLPAEPSTTLCT